MSQKLVNSACAQCYSAMNAQTFGCLYAFSGRRKKYMACRKKYKALILKYVPCISKYMACIFRHSKYLINNDL